MTNLRILKFPFFEHEAPAGSIFSTVEWQAINRSRLLQEYRFRGASAYFERSAASKFGFGDVFRPER